MLDRNSVVRQISPLHMPRTSFPPCVAHVCTASCHSYFSLRSTPPLHSCIRIHEGPSLKRNLSGTHRERGEPEDHAARTRTKGGTQNHISQRTTVQRTAQIQRDTQRAWMLTDHWDIWSRSFVRLDLRIVLRHNPRMLCFAPLRSLCPMGSSYTLDCQLWPHTCHLGTVCKPLTPLHRHSVPLHTECSSSNPHRCSCFLADMECSPIDQSMVETNLACTLHSDTGPLPFHTNRRHTEDRGAPHSTDLKEAAACHSNRHARGDR
jgi:hypothetical protein